MNVERTIAGIRAALDEHRTEAKSIAFVPTMGALHDGHLSLVTQARELGDVVVLSIFVNPLQFGAGEDLDRYPRPESRDLELAREAGVDLVFLPSVAEMYPEGADTVVSVGRLGDVVEGASRPGHFDGVATVVVKLLNIVQPRFALFGQKDAQQVAVVRKVVTDLSVPVEIVACKTIREPDGLALSSRNVYLQPSERASAVVLITALRAGAEKLGSTRDPAAASETMRAAVAAEGLDVDYAEVVDPVTFGPVGDGDALLVVAARAGATRLIDNLLVERGERIVVS